MNNVPDPSTRHNGANSPTAALTEPVGRPDRPHAPVAISVGQYKNQPRCTRVTTDNLCDMNAREPGEETWWSGNLWRGDYRKNAYWEALTVAMVDADYLPEVSAVPDDVRARVALAALPGDVLYHTPHGLRMGVVLTAPCTDPERAEAFCRGAGRALLAALAEQGVTGYHLDPVSAVKAQLFYAPNAVAKGVARQFVAVRGQPIAEATLLELGAAPLVRGPHAGDRAEVAAVLAKMEHEGPGDGSKELMCVAAKAVRLGVRDASEFLEAVEKWNRKRKEGERWADDDLVKRFADAVARWEGMGLVPVPTKYKRDALHRIVEGDAHFKGQVAYDEIEDRVLYNGAPVTLESDQLTDLEVKVCERYGYASVPRDALFASMASVAKRRRVNRVVQFLLDLPPWDGVPRGDVLLDAFRIQPEQRALAAIYFRKTLIAACARAIKPGCKHDHMLVLVGAEAANKSRTIAALAGPENFCDTRLDLENKDAYENIRKVWIYEWAELEAVTRKADVARVKNFLSSSTDLVRRVYAREATVQPRRGIFIGSANSRDFLRDPDSNRRFWPVDVGPGIDLARVERERVQTWAEHLEAYAKGEPWWLTQAQEEARAVQNALYEPDEPFLDHLEDVVQKLTKGDLAASFTSRDLYLQLGLDPTGKSAREGSMLRSRLFALGWVRARLNKKGVRIYGYKQHANSDDK